MPDGEFGKETSALTAALQGKTGADKDHHVGEQTLAKVKGLLQLDDVNLTGDVPRDIQALYTAMNKPKIQGIQQQH